MSSLPATDALVAGALDKARSVERVGKVAEAYGTLIRATGLKASIGELCELRNPPGEWPAGFRLPAEVVGVSDRTVRRVLKRFDERLAPMREEAS